METEVTPTVETPAEPVTSTSDIAAEVYDDHQDDATESAVSESPAPPAKTETLTPSEAEQMLREQGFLEERRPDGREHRIPRSKVLKMIESGLRKGREADTQKWQSVEQERNRYKADLDELIADAQGQDTRKFLERLATYNPGFRTYLQPAQQTTETPAIEQEPQLVLDQGNEAFLKSIAARDQWILQRAKREAESLVKPLTEAQKADQERRDREAFESGQRDHSRRQMTEAESWPGFGKIPTDGTLTAFQTEVLKVLQDDSATAAAEQRRPTMTLRQAYLEVQNRKLAIDDAARREALLKEIHRAPKSTAVTKAGGDTPSMKGGKASIRDIAASVLDSGA